MRTDMPEVSKLVSEGKVAVRLRHVNAAVGLTRLVALKS